MNVIEKHIYIYNSDDIGLSLRSPIPGRRKEFFEGVRFKCYFSKRLFFIDLSTNTLLYRKCIQFAPKKEGSSDPSYPLVPKPLQFLLLILLTELKIWS